MDENKKSSKLIKIISCLIIGLLVFSLLQIVTLNDKIDNLSTLNSRLSSEIQSLKNDINSIYSNVDEKMKEQVSLISGVDYSIGKPNESMTTAPLSLTVVPKIITDDMRLSVTIDDVTAPLEKSGNKFKGTINVDLFMGYGLRILLTIESSESTQTEYLDDIDVSYLFSDYMPTLDADMSSSSRRSNNTLHITSNLSINIKNKDSDVKFTSFAIVEELNGEEIGREDITAEVFEAGDDYNGDYSKSFEVSDEYELRIYVIAEDSLGYIYKNLADCWMESQMDAMVETVMDDVTISDKDGNVLYNGYAY